MSHDDISTNIEIHSFTNNRPNEEQHEQFSRNLSKLRLVCALIIKHSIEQFKEQSI